MTPGSREDAAELLALAAKCIAPRQASTNLSVHWRGAEYRVCFEWPGILRVVPFAGGGAVAVSRPGEPWTLGAWSDQ